MGKIEKAIAKFNVANQHEATQADSRIAARPVRQPDIAPPEAVHSAQVVDSVSGDMQTQRPVESYDSIEYESIEEEVSWPKNKPSGKRRRRQRQKRKLKILNRIPNRLIQALFIGVFCYAVVKVAIRLGS